MELIALLLAFASVASLARSADEANGVPPAPQAALPEDLDSDLLALNQKIYELLPAHKVRFIERISALVGEEYATKDPNSPRPIIIRLTLIEASVVAFSELYARSVEFNPSSSRTTHQLDERKFREYYSRLVLDPCRIILNLYEAHKWSIERFLAATKQIEHFTAEGRLRIWAGDCKFLSDPMIQRDVLDELKLNDPRHYMTEGASPLGCPRHYLRRSASFKGTAATGGDRRRR